MARPLPIVEMFYSGAWQPVTEDVYSSAGASIQIARGRGDWAEQPDPSQATIPLRQSYSAYATLPGGDPMIGRYAPENPMSDLYGLIGRNTPVRIRLGESAPVLWLIGDEDAAASTPDTAALRLTGDQRVELYCKPDTWRPLAGAALARRYETTTGGRAWAWWMGSTGTLHFRYSTDGTTPFDSNSTAAIPDDGARRWISAAIDVANATNHVISFATSPDGTSWTTLGTPVTVPGNITIHPAQVPLEVGRTSTSTSGVSIPPFAGEIDAFRYRSGILSTSPIVSSVDFTSAETVDRTIVDAQGRTWTLTPKAYIADPAIRFTGEAAAWPQTWNETATVRSANLTAAGVSRRAQRHLSPLHSSLRRDLSTKSNVAAYYPMEETKGAPRFASGLPGDTTYLAFTNPAEIDLAASDTFVASAPLPTFGEAEASGRLPSYTPNAAQRLTFLLRMPDDPLATDRHIMRVYTTGTAARWEFVYDTGGGLITRCFDDDGTAIFLHGPAGNFLHGTQNMMSLWLEQQGVNVFFQFAYFPVGSGTAFITDEGLLPSRTFGRIASVQLGTTGGLGGAVLGHVALFNGDVHNVWDTVGNALVAWAGEPCADRLVRLGADEESPVRLTGPGATVALGPQRTRTFTELIREAPATDLGILIDADDAPAYAYRPAAAIGAAPALTVPYSLISPPFQPVDDDQATVNRVTVVSANGIEFTAEDTTSPMSTLPPPAGVGRYDQQADINANLPADVESNAWWRLALGTINASRWPEVTFHLDNPGVAAIAGDLLALKVGDLLRITDLPAGVPPGPIDLIIGQITDAISRPLHTITFTCEPGQIWASRGTWADPTGAPAGVARWDTSATTRTGTPITSTATSFALTIGDGMFWTTTPADFPFDIIGGGERMTVTAISAPSGTSQTFTVTRAVNGVTKAHPVGTRFTLAEPTYWSM